MYYSEIVQTILNIAHDGPHFYEVMTSGKAGGL